MFWANNNSSGYSLNSAIQVHTAIMEAFHEIEGNTAHTDLMKQWLLRQKQTQNWGNTPEYSRRHLCLTPNRQYSIGQSRAIDGCIGKSKNRYEQSRSNAGLYQNGLSSYRHFPRFIPTYQLQKNKIPPVGEPIYLQYFDQLKQVQKKKKDILNIEKKLFIEKNSEPGPNSFLSTLPCKSETRLSYA